MSSEKRIEFTSRLEWVRLDRMKISPLAQRRFDANWGDELARTFDPDLMGCLSVSLRDGWYYVVDGQHRRHGAIEWLGADQAVLCHVFEGLTQAQEAELFLSLNNAKKQSAMSKYQVALVAQDGDRPVEHDVNRITRALGLVVGSNSKNGEISCVTALINTYKKRGAASLSFALRVTRDAYGYDGFKAPIISSLALIHSGLGNQVDEETLVQRLAAGQLADVHNHGKSIQQSFGRPTDQSYAAAIVDAYNAQAKGRAHRLAPWFQSVGV